MRNVVRLVSGLALLATPACSRLDDLWNATPRATDRGDASPAVGLSTDAPSDDDASEAPADDASAPSADAAVAPSNPSSASSDAAVTDAALAVDAAVDAPPRETITALAARTGIVEAPNGNARWVGYVRAGGRVALVRGPVGNDGCPARRDVPGAGWWQVEGGGYMCVGNLAAVTSTLEARGLRRFPVQADLGAAMPFQYGITTRPTAMYRWAPTTADERVVEPERFVDRSAAAVAARTQDGDGGVVAADDATVTGPAASPLPQEDAGARADAGDGAVRIEELQGDPSSPLLRRMLSRMYVSLDRVVRAESGANYWHTYSNGFVRTNAVSTLNPASITFQGQRLEGNVHLPVAFAISAVTPVYTQAGTAMRSTGRAPRLSFFQLTGDAPVHLGADDYYRTADGTFVRSRNVRVITAHAPPADLAPNEKWIDVNLDHQSLVAYEGTTPVYVTVASTGLRRRSLTENYETIQGGFRIQSKHVATTMDGNSNDGPYSIEDVPWVMYFEQSFALHGAFWHNGFGMVHSHGCVNLSPPDARWVFAWSEPRLVPGAHGAYATPSNPGTRVYVHYDTQSLGERGGPAHIPTH